MSLTQNTENSADENNRQGEEDKLRIEVSYGDLKVELSGSPESVLQSINSLLAKQFPNLKLAQKISLNYTLAELIEGFQNFIRITPEGPRVVVSELSDKHILAIQLVAQRIAFETGNSRLPSMSLTEIQEITGLKPKSISSRLSELSKDGYVSRESDDTSETVFRISTLGIKWLQDSLGRKKN